MGGRAGEAPPPPRFPKTPMPRPRQTHPAAPGPACASCLFLYQPTRWLMLLTFLLRNLRTLFHRLLSNPSAAMLQKTTCIRYTLLRSISLLPPPPPPFRHLLTLLSLSPLMTVFPLSGWSFLQATACARSKKQCPPNFTRGVSF
jgi:hypothetical protein